MKESGFAEDDAGFGEVVGGEFDLYFVPGDDADEVFAHFAGDVGEDVFTVWEVHAEHGAGEDSGDGALYFDGVFLRHGGIV